VQSVRINKAGIGKSTRQVVTANIVYKKASSLHAALAHCSADPCVTVPHDETGVEKWKAEYWAGRPDIQDLKMQVDAAVNAFDDASDRSKAEQILQVSAFRHRKCRLFVVVAALETYP